MNDDVKEKIPRSQTLPQTLRGKNGLSASSLVILDSRTIMIKDFTFMGLAPGMNKNITDISCLHYLLIIVDC